ncbi:MAG TPA: GAP family protein [Candidatus Limnocylindrales bacterium]|nr:GAP family protein [Candidatus Limnocylindrales bacterium]
MVELWTTLIPLALGSAIIPVEIALTILVLKAPGGVPRALAWVGGMTVVRLAQWVILGPIVDTAVDDGQPGTSLVEGALLLVVGILFLVIAARKATDQPDEDAPPPGWMAMMDDVSAGRAFLMGAALIALNPKLWAFTLGTLGAIGDAELTGAAGLAAFLVFVAIAQGFHLGSIALTVVAPARAERVLGGMNAWLERHSRTVLIAFSGVFGVWLLAKSLAAFGIL